MKLQQILKEWVLENLDESDKLEEAYFNLHELKIDELNSYPYTETEFLPELGFSKAWEFEDRCGNKIVAVYQKSIKEFKSGYRIEGVSTLIFDPKKLKNFEDLIKPCADDKKVNTVYKILIEEVVPAYLLNQKPNKLIFNPISSSRARLVDMIINKVIQTYPQLIKKNNQLIYL